MSGIKIYNAVNVNTSFLPKRYPDSLNFIVKGVNHKLSGNSWETSIETVVIAQNTDKDGKPFLSYKQIKSEVKKIIKTAQVKIAAENPDLPPDIITPPKSTSFDGTGTSESITPTGAGTLVQSSCAQIPATTIPASGVKSINASSTDEKIIATIVAYIEGGYYHPTHAYLSNGTMNPGYTVYNNSGETLYGIDRYAGNSEGIRQGPLNQTGVDFWSAVDQISGFGNYKDTNRRTKTGKWDISAFPKKSSAWSHYYKPKPSDPGYASLQNNLVKFMRETYDRNMRNNFSQPLQDFINKDGRLRFLFFRSSWNGSGYFQKHANAFKESYNKGERNVDKLICSNLVFRYNDFHGYWKKDPKDLAALLDFKVPM
jgi:hypothetical protein